MVFNMLTAIMMCIMGNYLSRQAAVSTLKRFFSLTDSDTVTVENVFLAGGRDLAEDRQNRQWLSNKLTAMKDYGFVERHYAPRDGASVLSRLSLTAEGKKALGRPDIHKSVAPTQEELLPDNPDKQVTISSVRRDVNVLRQQEPELDILFDVRLKEEVSN